VTGPAERVEPSGETGQPDVDAALAALADVADAPPAEQVVPLTEAHRVLSETLDSIGPV
jgi:hypothetical protein